MHVTAEGGAKGHRILGRCRMRFNPVSHSLHQLLERSAELVSMVDGAQRKTPLEGPLADPDKLDTLELWYHLYKEDGAHVIGDPQRVFAAYHPETGKLQVFAKDQADVEIVPYSVITLQAALKSAQEEKASFSVVDSQVSCCIGKVQAVGASYGEAALRALLKHERLVRSSE